LCFYFIADQKPLFSLQNKAAPHDKSQPLTPFSQWMVKYAIAMGEFLDTPESMTAESEQTFYNSPNYNMGAYIRPRGGWKSFNQIFARHFKPGLRPISNISDQSVIVSPADATFAGQWEIRENSNITVKKLNWKISELLEARVIHGQVYLEVKAIPEDNNPGMHSLNLKRVYNPIDNIGYQFAQSRGLIVLDTAIGLVAVLPIGMCQVASVVITAEVGVNVRKGEELSYFQFGGSDIIVLFESSANVSFTAQPSIHYKMGTRIANSYTVS